MPTVRCRRRVVVSWDGGGRLREVSTINEDEGCINFEELEDLLEDDSLGWDDEEDESANCYDGDEKWDEGEEDEAGFEEIELDNGF